MPLDLTPMLATLSTLPANEQAYAFEFKWDGIRALAFIEDGQLRLISRRGNDVTAQYPELRAVARGLGGHAAVLDGEIVALDPAGRADFGLLQQRMNLLDDRDVARRRTEIPVHLFFFDVLFLDRESLLRRPYEERRRVLDALQLAGPHWQTPPYWKGEGEATLEASRSLNMEGVVAKRLDSPYVPGTRSGLWLKIKNRQRQEFVVGGWTAGEGNREATFGSLLVGFYEDARPGARFRFAGRVGSGFNERLLEIVEARLTAARRDTSPFAEGDVERGATYVEPTMVIEVEFSEWTHLGTLRQASFKGLRDDKDPRQVLREVVVAPPGGR